MQGLLALLQPLLSLCHECYVGRALITAFLLQRTRIVMSNLLLNNIFTALLFCATSVIIC